MLSFIDHKSRYSWRYFLRYKSHVKAAFLERESGKKLKTLHSDRGGEYMDGQLAAELKSRGISHTLSSPDTQQQNGVAERWNRTIIEAVRTSLHAAGLSTGWWGGAVKHAVWVHNRVHTRSLPKGTTPFECCYG